MAPRRQRYARRALALAALLQPTRSFQAGRPTVARTALRSSSSDPAAVEDDTPIAVQKAVAAMTAFSNRYVKVSGTKYCSEPSVPAVVIRGLAEHKVSLGAPLCPCRNYVDKEAEAKSGYWNCPCVPMRERHECHCMLFLPEDNGFAGDSDDISLEEVVQLTAGFKPPPAQ